MAHWRQVNTSTLANRGHCVVCLKWYLWGLKGCMKVGNYIKIYMIFHQYLRQAWGRKTAPSVWELIEKSEFKHKGSSGIQIHCTFLLLFSYFELRRNSLRWKALISAFTIELYLLCATVTHFYLFPFTPPPLTENCLRRCSYNKQHNTVTHSS